METISDNRLKSVLDVEVSTYASCLDTIPKTANLLNFLCSEAHKEAVEKVRSIEDKTKRDEAKKLLPAFTPSGLFLKREACGLLQHSGLLAIDIDEKENRRVQNFGQLKEELKKLPNIAYCGLSVSGRGFWCLIPIADPARHKEHFLAVEQAFNEYGITIDSSCKDVSRLRICSYDPEPYFNHCAKKFFKTATPATLPTLPISLSSALPLEEEEKKVIECIEMLEKSGLDITSTYQTWFEVGCSLANAFGERGRELFHGLSRLHFRYNYSEADKQFGRCLRADYHFTLGTFFYYCKLVGVT